MSTGSLALKDITVIIDQGDQYNVNIRPSDNYNVSVTTGDQYVVNVMQPGIVRLNNTGSYFSIADSALTSISSSFAQTASYALNVNDSAAFPFTGSAEISGSLQVIGGTISGSFSGDGSQITGLVTDLRISGSSGSDIISLLTDSLSILGDRGVETTVTNNQVTISIPQEIISSSTQIVNYNLFATTGSNIFTGTQTAPSFTGSFSGSFVGDGSQLTGIATDLLISGSTGNDVLSLLTDTLSVLGTNGVTTTVTNNVLTINIPLGIVSSSTQVDYTQLQNIPVGLVSASLQVKQLLPDGTVSSSAQATTWTVLSSSFAETASYTKNAETIDGLNSTVFATTGSNIFVGDQTITGSLLTDADTLIFTGSILVNGTMEINSVITGSIVQAISASYIDGGFY